MSGNAGSKSGPKPIRVLGIAISETFVEGAVYSSAVGGIEASRRINLQPDVFPNGCDTIANPDLLATALQQVADELHYKGNVVLALPPSTLRMAEVPQGLNEQQTYSTLTADLYRYKAFENNLPIIGFSQLEGSSNLMVAAIRQDTYEAYQKVAARARLKLVGIDATPYALLRGMAVTGVLDALVQQIGPSTHWGMVSASTDRVRFSIWQGNTVVEFREVYMRTVLPDGTQLGVNDLLEDFAEEIQRTSRGREVKIWFTDGVSNDLNAALREEVKVPFKLCPLAPDFPVDRPDVHLAAIGTAMKCVTGFPFDLDFLFSFKKQTKALNLKTKSSGMSMSMPSFGGGFGGGGGGGLLAALDPEQKAQFIYPALVGVALVALVWVGTTVYRTSVLDAQYSDLSQRKTALTGSIDQLKQQVLQETKYSKTDQFVRDVGTKIILRNLLLSSLVQDLKAHTPDHIWLDTVNINNQLELTGIALNHGDVMDMALNFDKTPYAYQLLVQSVKETVVGKTQVFSFVLSGGIDDQGLTKMLAEREAKLKAAEEKAAAEKAKKEAEAASKTASARRSGGQQSRIVRVSVPQDILARR